MFTISGASISGREDRQIYADWSDPLTVSDLLARNVVYMLTFSDPISLGEASADDEEYTRSIEDTLTITNTISTQAEYYLDVSDTLTLSQDMDLDAQFLKMVSDTISFTETVTPLMVRSFNMSDDLTLTDIARRALVFDFTDPLTISNTLIQEGLEQLVGDTLEFEEQVELNREAFITFSDTLTIDDSTVNVIFITFQDTLHIYDTYTASQNGLTHFLTDFISLGETITFDIYPIIGTSDALLLTDSIVLHTVRPNGANDVINFTQEIAVTSFRARNLIDQIVFTESATHVMLPAPRISDIISITDSIVNSVLAVNHPSDTFTITDAVNFSLFPQQNMTDTLHFNQFVSINKEHYAIICDCIHFIERAGRGIPLSVTDTLSLTDEIDPYGHHPNITDVLNLGETLATNIIYGDCCNETYIPDKKFSDVIEFSESVTIGMASKVIAVADTLTLVDGVAYYGDF